jgi:hypothetical protein
MPIGVAVSVVDMVGLGGELKTIQNQHKKKRSSRRNPLRIKDVRSNESGREEKVKKEGIVKSDASNCPSLLPPESPFVFWSIPRLAYLGLA